MDHPDYLGLQRTIFSLKDHNINYIKHFLGLLIYIVIFVLIIPYFIIAYGYWNILSAYFPNLDMIATIIGYHGGPLNSFIWTHLYNPSDITLTGYITSNIINLLALLGVIFVIIKYAQKSKTIFPAAARASIMLLMTYFIPGNFIVYLMNKFGKYLNRFFLSKTIVHYLLVLVVGVLTALVFIISEAILIDNFVPALAERMQSIYKTII
jgi:hypothetical protein